MALTGDRYVGTYEGHTVELIRNNWVKSLSLWIDGNRVASAMYIWPWPTTLTGTLEHDGVAHAVVARSVPATSCGPRTPPRSMGRRWPSRRPIRHPLDVRAARPADVPGASRRGRGRRRGSRGRWSIQL